VNNLPKVVTQSCVPLQTTIILVNSRTRCVSDELIVIDSERQHHAVAGRPRTVMPAPSGLRRRGVPVDAVTLRVVHALCAARGERRRRLATLGRPHAHVRIFRPPRRARIFRQATTSIVTPAKAKFHYAS